MEPISESDAMQAIERTRAIGLVSAVLLEQQFETKLSPVHKNRAERREERKRERQARKSSRKAKGGA